MNKLQIGWSEIDITPDKKVALAGQFAERISEYVEQRSTQKKTKREESLLTQRTMQSNLHLSLNSLQNECPSM